MLVIELNKNEQNIIVTTTRNYFEFLNNEDIDFMKKHNIKINRDAFNSITLIKIPSITSNEIIGEAIKRILRNFW